MTFDQIFRTLESMASQHAGLLPADDDFCANLHIVGPSSGTIGVELLNGRLSISNVVYSPCDAEVTISADDLMLLISGNLNPLTAVMSGRIRLSGNVAKVMRLIAKIKK